MLVHLRLDKQRVLWWNVVLASEAGKAVNLGVECENEYASPAMPFYMIVDSALSTCR